MKKEKKVKKVKVGDVIKMEGVKKELIEAHEKEAATCKYGAMLFVKQEKAARESLFNVIRKAYPELKGCQFDYKVSEGMLTVLNVEKKNK